MPTRPKPKFEGMGVDFLPAVRKRRTAFDHPQFRAAAAIDKWLKSGNNIIS